MAEPSTYELGAVLGWVGRDAVDPSGEVVGKVADVYLDASTYRPDWLTVSTGLFGTKVSFVPVEGARPLDDDRVELAWDKEQVAAAPVADEAGALTDDEEVELFAHYGRPLDEAPHETPAATPAASPATDLAELDREPESAERRPIETGSRLRRHER